MTSSQLEFPVDDTIGPVMESLDGESVLETCREQLRAVDSSVRREWRQGRIIEALYHPGRYVRVAYALTADPTTPDHRVWPESDIVYLNAPVRRPMSRRGVVLSLGGAEVEVYRFPDDRRLRGLRRFTGRDPAAALWQQWIGQKHEDRFLDPDSLQRVLIRYVPEQKCIVRLRASVRTGDSGKEFTQRITVRVADSESCASLLNRHVALRRWSKRPDAMFRVGRVIGGNGQSGMLAVKWTQGETFLESLERRGVADVMSGMAAALRSFHASSVPDLGTVTLEDMMRHARSAIEDLSSARPELGTRLDALVRKLSERLKDAVARFESRGSGLVTLHNDLHVKQIRIDKDDGCFKLLDLERMAIGDPTIDVANLATQLRLLADRPEFSIDAGTAQCWTGEFLRAWEQCTGEALHGERLDRFRCYSVLSMLSLARGMMRHLRPGWRALADRCAELAEAELALSDPEVTAV